VAFSTHLRCDRLVEIASDYLERALSAQDAEQLEQHLVICGACAAYVAQLRAVQEAAHQLGAAPVSEPSASADKVLRDLLQRFRSGGTP
jgi:anti-sigma factor RsiW